MKLKSINEILEFIENSTLDELLAYGLEEKNRNLNVKYKSFKNSYTKYFLKKKDYKRLIWNLLIKRIRYKPFSQVFYNEMPPASYSEKDGIKPTFEEGIVSLKSNIEKIKSIPFNKDDKTQSVLYNIINYRLNGDKNYLLIDYDHDHLIYFDDDLIQCKEKEVFVDCGGYVGDTTEAFIKKYKNYERIYFFEPDPINKEKSKKRLSNYTKIEFIQKVLDNKNTKVKFKSLGDMGSRICTDEKDDPRMTDVFVDSATIDSEIEEEVTFIKMDIEGNELNALKGAYNHIKKDTPKLAISLYHKLEDLYEIPLYILSINPNYKLFLRHYGTSFSEVVLYGIVE